MSGKLLTKAEKMARVPGIVYVDGAVGRRAHVIGGLDVFEVIRTLKSCNGGRAVVAEVHDHMTPEQLQAAYDFYELFPEEIDERLRQEAVLERRFSRRRGPFLPHTYDRERLRKSAI